MLALACVEREGALAADGGAESDLACVRVRVPVPGARADVLEPEQGDEVGIALDIRSVVQQGAGLRGEGQARKGDDISTEVC